MKLIENYKDYSLWESVYGDVIVLRNGKPPKLLSTFKTYHNAIAWLRRRGYVSGEPIPYKEPKAKKPKELTPEMTKACEIFKD
jgi:hypothetical protein